MINADYMLLQENIFHFKQREKYAKRNRAPVNYELTSDGLMGKQNAHRKYGGNGMEYIHTYIHNT